jgi:hypothetical protein
MVRDSAPRLRWIGRYGLEIFWSDTRKGKVGVWQKAKPVVPLWVAEHDAARDAMPREAGAEPRMRRPRSFRAFLLVPAQAVVGRFVETFKEFPPRAKAASFTVSDVMEKIAVGNAK